jgi:uncharacterized membrane protein
MKFLAGLITALLFSTVIIWSIEQAYSFWQVFIGFGCFILPVIFFSGIKSNAAVFIFLTASILFGYLTFKWDYTNVWAGILLALILGLPIHYLRVKKTEIKSGKKSKA